MRNFFLEKQTVLPYLCASANDPVGTVVSPLKTQSGTKKMAKVVRITQTKLQNPVWTQVLADH